MTSNNGAYLAPFAAITPTDRGGALLIVNTIGLIISLVSVGVRVYISHRESDDSYIAHKDDYLCFAGLAASIIEFALVSLGVHYGNGKTIDLIPPSSLVRLQQIQYATEIFYILSLFCSRTSMIFLYQRIQGIGPALLWRATIVALSVWAIACIFITALKCNLHQPWIQYNVSCTGLLARWQFIQVSSIVIEVAMFALGIYLVTAVRMKVSSKAQVLTLFGTRVIVVVFLALCLAYLPDYFHSSDPTYRGIPASLYALAAMYSSLVTTTTPLLKSFIVKFHVIGANPTVLVQAPHTTTLAPNTQQREADEDWRRRMSKWQARRKRRRIAGDLDKSTSQLNSTRGSLSGFSQWAGRHQSARRHPDAATTPGSDDGRSNRTLLAAQTDAESSRVPDDNAVVTSR